MSNPEATRQPVCPYLGIAGDPSSHYSFPEGSHRCHARKSGEPIELAYQGAVCMGAAYPGCRLYQGAQGSASPPTRRRRWAGVVGRIVVIAALVLLAVIAVAVGRTMLDGPIGAIVDQPAPPAEIEWPGPTIAPEASPPPPAVSPAVAFTPSPPPVSLDEPTPSPTALPTPSPTPTVVPATPSPTPTPLIHVVSRDETITYLGALYGVTKRAIVEANQIENPDLIYLGQRLIIPLPTPQPEE